MASTTPPDVTPGTGNPVFTVGTISLFVAGAIKLLRAYGHDITGGQEEAWLEFIKGPAGDLIVLIVAGGGMIWLRQNVYTILSVFKLTRKNAPEVPASPPLVPPL